MQGNAIDHAGVKPPASRKTRIWHNTLEARKQRFGIMFALPAFLFFGFFYIYPLFRTFQVSLYSWSLLDEPSFRGMANYTRLFADKEFINSIWVTFYYAIGVVEDHIAALRGRVTVVIVTHNLAQARRIADRLAVFWVRDGAGTIVETGPAANLFTDPTDPDAARYLSGERG